MRSAGVIAVWVRAAACFSGSELCALACAVSVTNAPRTTNRPAACMGLSPTREGREGSPGVRRATSPIGCAVSRRSLVRNGGPAPPQRPCQNAEACPLTLAAGHRSIQQDDDDPRQPAGPLAPAQRPQHEPRLGERRGPRLPVALHERERPGKDAIGMKALRAGLRNVPYARHLAPAVIV